MQDEASQIFPWSPKLATAEECEKTFGMPAKYFLNEARAGKCPCVRYNREFKFSIPAVQKWLHDVASTPQQRPTVRRQKKAKPEPVAQQPG